jgi:4-amino-4-deoxychorismate lyase
MKIVFCNGKFIDESEPCIPLTDRGFLFGDAVFTTIKVENGIPFFFEEHVARLFMQCETLRITPPVILLKNVNDLIIKNEATVGVWRLKIIITGGNSPKLSLQTRGFGKLLMTLRELSEQFPNEVRLTVYPKSISGPTASLKTLSYLDRLYVAEYAFSRSFDEAVVLSGEGFILETAFSNIFWIEDRDVFVPDPQLDLLMGITIRKEIEVFKEKGYTVHFVKAKLEDISAKAKVFVCNSIRGVTPVKELCP